MTSRTSPTRVVLERGRTWVFASAVDWPGWCRRGKGEEAALDDLAAYEARYREAVGDLAVAGMSQFEVLETLPGTPTTDFGAPDARSVLDDEPADAVETARLLTALDRCWARFDTVAAAAPEALRKGPRGGGRDTGAVVDHVREAERSYVRKIDVRVPPRTPWPEQRAAIRAGLEAVLPAGPVPQPGRGKPWPPRYLLRRTAWHVLDHAWEIEDRSD